MAGDLTRVGLSLLYLGNWSGTGSYTGQIIRALCSLAKEGIEGVGLLPRNQPITEYCGIPIRRTSSLALRWPFKAGSEWIGRGVTRDLDLLHYPAGVGPPRVDIPMVATIHDVSPFVLPSALPPIRALYLRKVFSMIAKRARVLLADTQWQALRIVEALPASAGKIQVVPPACDPVFHPESGPPVRRVLGRVDAPFILAVGTLEPRKNIEHLVTAWKDSSFEGDLVLVGRWGWKYDRLLRLLDSFGHRDILEDGGRSWTLRYGRRICRYEYLPAEDLADLYRRSRCLVYPSVFEGFGLPVLEAMACGCPVITSRDSAMEEVAADAGWYCDPDDPDSITATIEARLSGEEECRRRVLIGLERACEFSQEAFANRLLAVYQEARR